MYLRRNNPKDPHGENETVVFKPAVDSDVKIDAPTALEARHLVATYALFRFANNLNLKMQLPPPHRAYWIALEAFKAASPKNKHWQWALDPFAAAASAPAPRPLASTDPVNGGSHASSPIVKPLPVSKAWLSAPEVQMSPHLRELVEDVVRSHSHLLHQADVALEPISEAELATTRKSLLSYGFRTGHVDSTLAYLQNARSNSMTVLDAAIDHLQLTIPEEDLPATFMRSKTKDANITLSSHGNSDALAKSWLVERIVKNMGVPSDLVLPRFEVAGASEGLTIDILLRDLACFKDVWSSAALVAQTSDTARDR